MTRTIRLLCVAMLTVVGLIGTTLPARADDDRRVRCEKRIHDAEARLQDAVQRHGDDSKAARKRRAQLEEERRNCPDYRGEHHDDMEHHDHDQH